jgi:hypothetical protein
MKRNECLDAIVAVLDDAGIGYTIKHGGKHTIVSFFINGREQFVPCSRSPSRSWRAWRSSRALTRRAVRECST